MADKELTRQIVEPENYGPADPNTDSDRQVAVVAVGASAGGLEAFTALLRRLPVDTGLAFVFIQHLAPQHSSMLAKLLSRETEMPVHQVEDGAVLAPNQVYVIPPNAAMTISGLALALQPRDGPGTAIDSFLGSLAASRKNSAIAVILSGTGSDGALGIQAIAEEGGVVFVQDPASAKFDGMPRSAIATGCVDFVLPPDEIAAEVARIAREPRVIQRDPPAPPADFASGGDFEAILDRVRAATGIDFGMYRQTTVCRRLMRRLALLRLGSLRDYVAYVDDNPGELHSLTQDVLIRVTHFFRDPAAFEALARKVFPVLIRRTPPDRTVRVWAPGCSTGEEAYSLAISFMEVAEQMRSRLPLQIFATDINEAAIEKARRGMYIENIAADVSSERLARFFVREGREYQVCRRLRDLCVFSSHDLLNDPPFSRMDLISCRNVLIYLDSVQGHAISRFHFALNPGGFLLLGKSETPSPFPGLFSPLDKEARIYTRQESARRPAPAIQGRAGAPRPPRDEPALRPLKAMDIRRQADRVMVQRYGPSRVIVNAKLEAVADSDENAAFLPAAPGARNQTVLEVLKRSAADALTEAVRSAANTGQSIRVEPVELVGEGAPLHQVSFEVTPLGTDRQHFLIVVEELPAHPEPDREAGGLSTGGGRLKSGARIGRLEKELASSRAHLESVIVEQEAAAEELVASNEELQSLNEELESSKEELEATNEELTTVNQELQVRNAELESSREFAQATIDTVRGSLVVLGSDLRVLKANRSFYRTFRLSPQQAERHFIYELGDGLFGAPRLRALLEEALPVSRTLEDVEIGNEDPSAGGRVLLLNARRFEGEERILLAIEDVTERRRAEVELRQSQKMEAIGYLAAGVAHDFNNLLTGMIGNASLLLETLPGGGPESAAVQSVISGGERAAELTRQLLAYAGKGRFFLERVDLSEVAIQTSRLIHPSIPPAVQLRLDLDKHLPLLLADPSQMQQVVMNLTINAAEAVGRSGMVQLKTGCQTLTGELLENCVLGEKAARGEYVFIEVMDNGCGMDEDTKRRMFDPFFTTKFTGRGLGLAAVMGIVRQQKAVMQVHSVPGRGSSFKVLFPTAEEVQPKIAGDGASEDLRGVGTVLVIDDEQLIRSYTKSALESYGYRVLLAGNGMEGVQALERSGDIGLVLLDVAMPGMDGLETLIRIREVRPDVPALICSGYGDMEVEAHFAGHTVAGFFAKPYTAKQLARKVKQCIAPAPGKSAVDPGRNR